MLQRWYSGWRRRLATGRRGRPGVQVRLECLEDRCVPSTGDLRGALAGYGQLPLSFEMNKGQTDPQVNFLSRGSGYTLFLTPSEAVLSLKNESSEDALRMQLVGA